MPAAFAHDLYGRKVYMEADPVIKRIIKKERYYFLLGAHGPDVLFLQSARKEQGEPERRENARGTGCKAFERGKMLVHEAETRDERDEMIAYLMGVACHFCLDNRVHAYAERGGETDRDHPRGDRDGAGETASGARTHAAAPLKPHLPFKDYCPDCPRLLKTFR